MRMKPIILLKQYMWHKTLKTFQNVIDFLINVTIPANYTFRIYITIEIPSQPFWAVTLLKKPVASMDKNHFQSPCSPKTFSGPGMCIHSASKPLASFHGAGGVGWCRFCLAKLQFQPPGQRAGFAGVPWALAEHPPDLARLSLGSSSSQMMPCSQPPALAPSAVANCE